MKALIAATCLAVLAAVGYFFWGEYEARAAKAQAEKRAMHRAEASMCTKMIGELRSGDFTEDWRGAHLALCVRNAHLSAKDFEGPTMMPFYEKAQSVIKATSK